MSNNASVDGSTIELIVRNKEIHIIQKDLLTSSQQKNKVKFNFVGGPPWENLQKTIIFRVEKELYNIALGADGVVNIPWEVCQDQYLGKIIYVGVRGVDNGGTLIYPTPFFRLGVLENGAGMIGTQEPSDPTMPPYDEAVRLSKLWAIGSNNTTETPSTTNNSKYWSDEAKISARTAQDAVTQAQSARHQYPKIGSNGHWEYYVPEQGRYVDSGMPAQFTIRKVYETVEAMMADYNGKDTTVGDFVMISGDMEAPDAGKLYVKVADNNVKFSFIADLSGAQGIQGPQGPAGPAGADGKDGAGMDITGATAGQIAKITAVDDSGKPTAWEPVDIHISFKPAGKSYLTFSSPNSFTLVVNDATKHWDGTLEYFASDKTWTVWDGTTTLSAIADDGEYVLYLRGTGNTVITGVSINTPYSWVLIGTDIKCIGNIENLLDYATVASGEHPTMENYCYNAMFYGCTSLTQAPALPATTLASYCYEYMFQGCTSLTKAPALPATTLASNCYNSMFFSCTSLTQAPALPATTLASYCYNGMFKGCTSLTQAPALPAMTLENHCYNGMFYNCTSLTQAPALPATTLAINCYEYMFYGCMSLTQAPALPATMMASYCYEYMFKGCTSLKLSTTQTGEYTQEYRIPSSGEGATAANALTSMFTSTGGTFTGTPAINTTYYLSSDNMIVRETEVATLNGYVDSMIDVAIDKYADTAEYIVPSSTAGSTKKFKITVDDSGTLTATEVV